MKKNLIIIVLVIIGASQNLISQKENITINYKRNTDNSIDFYYEKSLPGSFYLNLKFTTLSNTYNKKYNGVVKNNSGNLLKLKPLDNKQPVNFSYKYSYVRGIPNPNVDSLFVYNLPFKKNKSVTVLESKNLSETYFGQEKPSKWKSYTIDKISADTVCSMRKGIVVEIVNEFTRGTSIEYEYTSKMNRIIIEHEDGTFATYTGLKKVSFFVTLGQTVYPQSCLGILDIFNDSLYRLYFNIHYIIDDEMNFIKKETPQTKKNRNEYLTPIFLTNNGAVKLKNQNTYIIEFNETILQKEFTKREIKNHKKKPEMFK